MHGASIEGAAARRAPALGLAVGLIGWLSGVAGGQTITVIDERPRLVFRVEGTEGFRSFADVRTLYATSTLYRNEVQGWATGGSYSGNPIHEAARFVLMNSATHATNALNAMNTGSLGYSGSEGAETAAQWALAYDWIYSAWGATPPPDVAGKLATIEGKIASWVGSALGDLDSSGPSLWHGRAALGAIAWVAALALPTGNATYDSYRSRAWNHWQQSLKATGASGGWPEGPTYWINNRALTFPLAYQAYQSAVGSAPALTVSDPLEDLRILGLWQAYTERGDGSFERYGDVASAVRINNGTPARSMDYYALVTQDPALAAFAQSARKYRYPSYHAIYGWNYVLGYDPTIAKPPGYDANDPAASLTGTLPNAMVFGRDSMGLVAMRQGWGHNAPHTAISFKAGDYLAHHGHYDQGTFTLFKYAPLVINSGGYGPYTGVHRLNYYVRTVGKNSILVLRPDEIWSPSGVAPPGGYANDGGQRIVNATGSSVRSYENWLANKTSGRNYESGQITAFANVDGQFTYVGSDITRAYNSTLYDSSGQGGKVSLVTRQMVYLHDNDILVVFDRVAATDPSYQKKWLLHTPNKLLGGAESVLAGSSSNGIMVVDGASIPNDTLAMTSGAGKLFLQVLLPAEYTVHKLGGTDYRYYVDGANQDDYSEQSYHDYGNWRIEVSPQTSQTFDTFLNVLTPRAAATASVSLGSVLRADPPATVMHIEDQVIGFGTAGPIGQPLAYDVPSGGTTHHLIADLAGSQLYRVTSPAGRQYLSADAEGTLAFSETAAGPHLVAVAVPHEWDLPGGGSYNAASNWKVPGVPSGSGKSAEFFAAVTAPSTVTVNSNVTLGYLGFDNAHAYTIAGPAGITLAGLGGNARVEILSGAHTVSADLTLLSHTDIELTGGSLTIGGGLTNSSGRRLTVIGSGTLTVSGPQSHGAGAVLEAAGGLTRLDSDAGAAGANLIVQAGADVGFGSTQHLAGLVLGGGATATLDAGGDRTLFTDALSIDGVTGSDGEAWPSSYTARLDINDNAMLLRYGDGPSPAGWIADLIVSGYNGGAWDGAGIASTAAAGGGLALGWADGADGVVPGLADGDVLVAATLPGDVNLDGLVDGDDYDWFLGFFGASNGAIWTMGDFTYDGAVEGDDYDVFLGHFGQSRPLPPGPWSADPAQAALPVPEPATATILLAAAAALVLGRRRAARTSRRLCR